MDNPSDMEVSGPFEARYLALIANWIDKIVLANPPAKL